MKCDYCKRDLLSNKYGEVFAIELEDARSSEDTDKWRFHSFECLANWSWKNKERK